MPVSIRTSLSTIVRKEGIVSLWNGNMAVCVRVFPYSAIQYVSYDYFKSLIYAEESSKVTASQRLSAGALAGITAVCTTYPLDLVRVRLACQGAGYGSRYRGMLHCIRRIYAEEGGIRALYTGCVPTLVGIVPYAAANFSIYETLKVKILSVRWVCNEEGEPMVLARLGCGAIAGAVGQVRRCRHA